MTEFSIAIVDDDKDFANRLKAQIRKWGYSNGCHINIDYISSASKFLDKMHELKGWSALFFDVQMPDTNGIELARKVRSISQDIPIAFISAYPLFSTDGYEVTACRFIVKNRPEFQSKLEECMQYILSKIKESEPKALYIKTPNSVTLVLYSDILYFESQSHNVLVKTTTDKFQYRKRISELISELPEYFIQTSRSYIVNMKHIKSIHSDSVELDNGNLIQLTRTYKSTVMNMFMRK